MSPVETPGRHRRRVGDNRYFRVLRMARKPTPAEYRRMVLVAAIGIALLGAIGFLIYFAMTFVPQ